MAGEPTDKEPRPATPAPAEIADYERRAARAHHHRGKSSEGLLDKAAILDALALESGQQVLDAGCGNGYMSKAFSTRVGPTGSVCALDPDDVSIATLRRDTGGTNIRAMVGDITTTTPLPASAFDLIYLADVVHGFPPEQLAGFRTEVKRLLAPGGRLAIVEIAKRETPSGPPMELRFSPAELKAALGLVPLPTLDVGEYFYMQLFENRCSTAP